MSEPNELRHYGKKGMEWGVRNKKDTGSGKTKKGGASTKEIKQLASRLDTISGDYKKVVAKKTAALSNETNILKRAALSMGIRRAEDGAFISNLESKHIRAEGGQKTRLLKGIKRHERELAKLDSKPPKFKTMSDAELKSTVDRMNLERSYRNLQADAKKANRSSLEIGADALASSGGKVVKSVITTQLTNALNTTIKTQLEK